VDRSTTCLCLLVSALILVRCSGTTLQYQGSLDTPETEYARALSFFELKKFDKVERALRRAIELDNSYAPAYVGMSRLFLEKGNVKEAIRYVHLARIQDINYIPCWNMAGHLYYISGQYSAAANEFQEAITRDQEKFWAVQTYFDLGLTLEKMGELEKAHEAYMTIISLDPLDLNARTAVKRIREVLGPSFLMKLQYENKDQILP